MPYALFIVLCLLDFLVSCMTFCFRKKINAFWVSWIITLTFCSCFATNYILFANASHQKFKDQLNRLDLIQKSFDGSCTDQYTTLNYFNITIDIETMNEDLNHASKSLYICYIAILIFFSQVGWFIY